ncbi:MAG: TMEM165/GDT1 family protein [Burkholderiales bacterium]
MLEALLTSTALVATAEIGDKTQLLSFALAARLKRPGPIILGILIATLANHALAATVGVWAAQFVSPDWQRWIVGIAFIVFGCWALIPDDSTPGYAPSDAGVFLTTLLAFFIAEMGDKTQLATIALAARYQDLIAVTLGTTLGMMIANVPAVLVGERLARHGAFRYVRFVAAALFIATGVLTLTTSPFS